MSIRTRATIVVLGLVGALFLTFYAISYGLVQVSDLPLSLELPLAIRLAGLAILLLSGAVIVWLFRHRSPFDFMISTYFSLLRLLAGELTEADSQREEPLVVTGPQRYVRHPIYSAGMIMMLGLTLLIDHTPFLPLTVILYFWFDQVVTRLEERELRALFGDAYRRYCERVPKFFPVKPPYRPRP